MSLKYLLGATIVAAAGCAQGHAGIDAGPGDDDDDGGVVVRPDGCGEFCDVDGDGVPDVEDECEGTPTGEDVNDVGCSDSQVDPTLNPEFPPYGLTWNPTGDPGRATGLTWTYTGIDRADMFHVYWIVCDDPATPCGLSLDGPIDTTVANEGFFFSAVDSNLAEGVLVYTNTTRILLADGSTPQLDGRLTLTIASLEFADVGTLGVTARDGTHGAEIPGTGFQVDALVEVRPASGGAWTPYLDYFDAQSTPDGGGGASLSMGGSFYDE